MKNEIKVGDCVVLKSGGPKMTVKGVGDYAYQKNVVLCVWFDGTKLKEEVFVPESIVMASE